MQGLKTKPIVFTIFTNPLTMSIVVTTIGGEPLEGGSMVTSLTHGGGGVPLIVSARAHQCDSKTKWLVQNATCNKCRHWTSKLLQLQLRYCASG